MRRRAWLARVGALAGGGWLAWTAGGTLGCAEGTAGHDVASLAVSDLPDGGRVQVLVDGIPVEVVRTGDSFVARSLQCTHRGCRVKWEPEEGFYQCPCHEGRFDADGNPIFGPPTEPLDRVPVKVTGDTLQVGPVPPPPELAV